MQIEQQIFLKRYVKNIASKVFAYFSTFIGLIFLAWILYSLVRFGSTSFNLRLFTEITPPPGNQGGLLNAIAGSFMIVVSAIILGTPIAVSVAVYLSEYGFKNKFATAVRFINDILLSAPSVIVGLFVYEIYVLKMGSFSGWAGVFALSLIALPIIIRATDNVLGLVPNSLKEAAFALGAPRWKVLISVILPIAKVGIITGMVLAIARISGETAPLLFTALNNQFMSLNMSKPIANLPTVIFQYAMSPYKDWHDLAWAGALLLTLMVLILNICVRILFRQKLVIH